MNYEEQNIKFLKSIGFSDDGKKYEEGYYGAYHDRIMFYYKGMEVSVHHGFKLTQESLDSIIRGSEGSSYAITGRNIDCLKDYKIYCGSMEVCNNQGAYYNYKGNVIIAFKVGSKTTLYCEAFEDLR